VSVILEKFLLQRRNGATDFFAPLRRCGRNPLSFSYLPDVAMRCVRVKARAPE